MNGVGIIKSMSNKQAQEAGGKVLSPVELAEQELVEIWKDGYRVGQLQSIADLVDKQGDKAFDYYESLTPEVRERIGLIKTRDTAARLLEIEVPYVTDEAKKKAKPR